LGVTAADTLKENPLPLLGRAVYELSVNMPNVNSYSGSWIIQFAEIKEDNESKGTVMPPSPRTKVDPVYSRAAIDEKIEGDVILHALIRRDGLVDNIEVIKPLDDRLDESAALALGKWRFNPATKDGVPIDVETVVRIPFRLIPLTDKDRR
jgi:TonB family protein